MKLYWLHMDRPAKNETFYFRQPSAEGPVLVFNEGSYLMCEYYPQSGIAKWQRVVATSQRDGIERRLRRDYPAPVNVSKTKGKRKER